MREILVADDHPLFRDALKRALTQAVPDAVMLEADGVASLQALVEEHADAELLLLDLQMPGANGFSTLAYMRAQYPGLPVVVVSAQEDPAVIRRAVAHGASGYIPKSASVDTIVAAVRRILDGDVWLPPFLTHSSSALQAEEASAASRIAELTPQQFRVLGMIAAGLLNKQIAFELNVSEATIKAHMTAIMRKLHVSNRTQVALCASHLALEQPAAASQPSEAAG
jgi:DNA-binding NarL/FixJ family response regulator